MESGDYTIKSNNNKFVDRALFKLKARKGVLVPIKLLDTSFYIGAECTDFDDAGITPATHIAAIKFSDLDTEPTQAFVKFCGPDKENQEQNLSNAQIMQIVEKRLFNEVLAYILAKNLNIRQPPRAAVLLLPLDKFRDNAWPLPEWISDNWSVIPAWCTEASPARSIRYQYKDLEKQYLEMFHSCKNWYGAIAAFDEWLANVDRNAGNILKLSSNVYSIIDHGRIFGNLDHNNLNDTEFRHENLMKGLIESQKKHLTALASIVQ